MKSNKKKRVWAHFSFNMQQLGSIWGVRKWKSMSSATQKQGAVRGGQRGWQKSEVREPPIHNGLTKHKGTKILFWRICNPPDAGLGICNACIMNVRGLQIPILLTVGLQIRPNREIESLCNHYYCSLGEMPILRLPWRNATNVGLLYSLEETTDHRRGCNPRDKCINKTKPWKGDRTLNLFNITLLMSLSSLRDFLCCFAITGGYHPRLWSVAPSALFPRQQ